MHGKFLFNSNLDISKNPLKEGGREGGEAVGGKRRKDEGIKGFCDIMQTCQ